MDPLFTALDPLVIKAAPQLFSFQNKIKFSFFLFYTTVRYEGIVETLSTSVVEPEPQLFSLAEPECITDPVPEPDFDPNPKLNVLIKKSHIKNKRPTF